MESFAKIFPQIDRATSAEEGKYDDQTRVVEVYSEFLRLLW